MKIDELKKAIRNVIREEVKKTVTEEVNKVMGRVLVEMIREIKSNKSSHELIKESSEENSSENERGVINTKNPKLNSVLNEMSRNLKPPRSMSNSINNLTELMGGFEKIGGKENTAVDQPPTKMEFLKEMIGQSPSVQQPSVLDGGSDVPDILKKVFKKDFRPLMKKIDEQKTGAGHMNTRNVLGG